MVSPEEIKQKALNKYSGFLQQAVEGVPFEPMVIACDKKPSDDFATYQREFRAICNASKEKRGFGYSITWKTIRHKVLGTQDVPKQIFFASADDFLRFIGKSKEYHQFMKDAGRILTAFPRLVDWVRKYPLKVVSYSSLWPDLLKVLTYFQAHPQPNLFVRELPIQVHTKFIEEHQKELRELLDIVIADDVEKEVSKFEERYHLKHDEDRIRFRFLDQALSDDYGVEMTDITLKMSEFCAINKKVDLVFVVENKVNFYTFPAVKNALVIWGHGYAVASLKESLLLPQAQLYYWGDLDAQGFEILSQFRGYFPHTHSFLMDCDTFERFFEGGTGTESKVSVEMHLTVAEQAIYERLKANNWRLEQEKISHEYVVKSLKTLGLL